MTEEPVELGYYRGARAVAPRTFKWICHIGGGLVCALAILALVLGSGLLQSLLLVVLALGALGVALLPRALGSTRTMLGLARQRAQLATLLPDLDVLAPWARPENGRSTPPDDLKALVAELGAKGTVSLGGLDGVVVTQQAFAADVGQKVLDQYPPGPPMMGSEVRRKAPATRSAR